MIKVDDIADDVSARCAAVRTLSTARAVTRHYDNALRPANLTITQFTLLVTVAKAAPESISQIADLLLMDRTSVSRNVALLEKKGLIQRSSETAARKRPVSLTLKGRSRLKKAYAAWLEAQLQVEERLSLSSFDDSMQALKALRKAV